MSDTSARVKPHYVITQDDLMAPAMSEVDWADLKRGKVLFDTHKFWDAHEAWEAIWVRHREPCRIFFQGLIQMAAACHQVQRGVYHGAAKHFNNALFKLTQFPDPFLTVRVAALVEAIEVCHKEVVRLGPVDLVHFDADLFPVMSFDA